MQDVCLDMWNHWALDRCVGLKEPHPCRDQCRLAAIKKRFPDAGDIMTDGVVIKSDGQRFAAPDVVLVGGDVGEVWWHCAVAGVAYTCISVWEPVATGSHPAAQYNVKLQPRIFESERIAQAAISKRIGERVVTVWPR